MIFWIFRDFGDAFAAFMMTTEGVARCHLHGRGLQVTSSFIVYNLILTHSCAKKPDDNPSNMNTNIIDNLSLISRLVTLSRTSVVIPKRRLFSHYRTQKHYSLNSRVQNLFKIPIIIEIDPLVTENELFKDYKAFSRHICAF